MDSKRDYGEWRKHLQGFLLNKRDTEDDHDDTTFQEHELHDQQQLLHKQDSGGPSLSLHTSCKEDDSQQLPLQPLTDEQNTDNSPNS
jgi:hypothetical protein